MITIQLWRPHLFSISNHRITLYRQTCRRFSVVVGKESFLEGRSLKTDHVSMRRRLFGRSSRQVYPIKQCHFCNVQSHIVPPHPSPSPSSNGSEVTSSASASSSFTATISTGTDINWFCSNCQCWNRADASEIGGISSWELKMSDEKQNIDSLQRRAVSTSSISKQFYTPSVSPFCHSCQTNQMLILSILANGDTDEMNDQEVAQWQLSLEDRYPPVCEVCQEVVKTKIERADKIARRLIWNGWLKRSKEKKAPAACPPVLGSLSQDHLATSADAHNISSLSVRWYIELLAFLYPLLSSIMSIFYRPRFGKALHIVRFVALTSSYRIARIWNPSLPRQIQLKRRLSPNSRIKVEGIARFRKALLISFLLQFIDQFDLPGFASSHIGTYIDINTARSALCTSLSLSFVQLIIAVLAFRTVKVLEPPSISLRSRATSLSSPRNQQYSATKDALLQSLSLNDGGTLLQQSGNEVVNAISEAPQIVEGVIEEVEMDWSPTPDMATSRSHQDFQLGPQRFFEPLKNTGLEEMLDKTLALGERSSKAIVKDSSSRSRLILSILLLIGLLLTVFISNRLVLYSPITFARYNIGHISVKDWLFKMTDRLRAVVKAHTLPIQTNDQVNVN